MEALWQQGPNPKDLDPLTIEIVKQLFLDQTGERYAETSVKNLPIPVWGGNLVLRDQNGMLRVNQFQIYGIQKSIMTLDKNILIRKEIL